MSTTFLSNDTLWDALSARIKGAHHVEAAFAFLGEGGSRLLPFSRGHRLIVDMSLPTVRSGGTDPSEIEKLIKRGVNVFTRRNLHAKVVVADNWVIAGSANVSKRSRDLLDEVGILTNDSAVVRRAREFIRPLCTEPVRPEYLQVCKKAYTRPQFGGKKGGPKPRQQRSRHAKLWLAHLREYYIPDSEHDRYEKGEVKAEKLIRNPKGTEIDNFNWPVKPKMADELEPGDWIIQSLTYKDKTTVVYPPGQLLYIDSYVRDFKRKTKRWVFHLEVPVRGETLSWQKFRNVTKHIVNGLQLQSPRTRPIREIQVADGLLGLWTPGGRLARS